jgi:uncharacterized protein
MTVTPSDIDKRLDNEGLWADKKTAITVSSGERVDPLNAFPLDIQVTDIAHSLSRTCRYNGHVGFFLSVARHSIWVAEYLEDFGDPLLTLTGLLHDSAEAYLGDLVRPLKHGPTIGVGYLAAEAKLETVIAERFGLEYPFDHRIHEADNYVLLERELSGPCARWTHKGVPEKDEQDFMRRYRLIQAARRAA